MKTSTPDSGSIRTFQAQEPSATDQGSSTFKGTPSTLAGILAVSALVTAFTLPSYLIFRPRLARIDATTKDVLRLARRARTYNKRQMDEVLREVKRVGEEVEMVKGTLEKVASDARDVRSVVLKERVRLEAVEGRFDGLREQLNLQEQRILDALATDQKRYIRTENDINGLRKTANQNAENLSKVAVSIAEIAGFIDQTEIEQGVQPEQGKESSKRVNALRNSALGVLQSTNNKPN